MYYKDIIGMRLRFSNEVADTFVSWLMQDRPNTELPMSDFERIKLEIRLCDVVLIEGRNRVSDVIKMVTQSRWTHAALYLGRLHDIDNLVLRKHIEENYHGDPEQQLVIESYLGKGTIVTPIDEYEGFHIRICRPHGITRQDAQHVISYAISHLGIAYDVRQIFDLLRYLLPWSIVPKRLRSSLFHYHAGSGTRQICSTLVAEAFASIQFPILPHVTNDPEKGIQFIRRNPRLCTPCDFDYSPYFQILKYPLFEVSGHAIYRNLPWVADTLSNGKEGLYIPTEEAKVNFIKKKSRAYQAKSTILPENLTQSIQQTLKHVTFEAAEEHLQETQETLKAAEDRLRTLEKETEELSSSHHNFKKIQDKDKKNWER